MTDNILNQLIHEQSERFRFRPDFVMETDWSEGQVVKAIDQAGVGKDTIVIFTADNGHSQVFSNTRGGIVTGAGYLGLLDIAAAIEFKHARVPLPGRIFLLAQQAHGQGLTEDYVARFCDSMFD